MAKKIIQWFIAIYNFIFVIAVYAFVLYITVVESRYEDVLGVLLTAFIFAFCLMTTVGLIKSSRLSTIFMCVAYLGQILSLEISGKIYGYATSVFTIDYMIMPTIMSNFLDGMIIHIDIWSAFITCCLIYVFSRLDDGV
jgi:hypothetical protein